jgi:hypothetical protein
MYNIELYENIRNSDIKQSIYITSKLLLTDENNIEIIENTFIHILGYIGTFISIFDIKLYIDVVNDLADIIDNVKIEIKTYYIFLTKLCIICDIYNKNPISKVGITDIKVLRERVISIFKNEYVKISTSGLKKFENLLPPIDSESYNLAVQILTGIIGSIKEIETYDSDNKDDIKNMANKLRNAFDYIIRKRFVFETKFYESDNNCIWFLWGIISLLCEDISIHNLYTLFNLRYRKKDKNNRHGLIFASILIIVYLNKKDISRNWDKKELMVIDKISEISISLYKEIKRDLINNNIIEKPSYNTVKKAEDNGLEYILNYKPVINNLLLENNSNEADEKTEKDENNVKSIKYKR